MIQAITGAMRICRIFHRMTPTIPVRATGASDFIISFFLEKLVVSAFTKGKPSLFQAEPMAPTDYILRMIEQMGQMLAALLEAE